MAHALSSDIDGGTAEAAAETVNWDGSVAAKTGTTESNQSAAFLGFTSGLAGAVYVYNDSPTTTELCTSPLRQCWSGDLYGGREPALTWFGAVSPIIDDFGGKVLPDMDPAFHEGTARARMPDVVGMQEAEAREVLEDAGYGVQSTTVGQTGMPRSTVSGCAPRSDAAAAARSRSKFPTAPAAPRPAPAPARAPAPPPGGGGGVPNYIDIPGFGRIQLPR